MKFKLTMTDGMNSVLQSVQSNSEVSQAREYSPYGDTTIIKDGECAPGFNGERVDALTGVTHLGNGYRAYNPALMRFHCPDSMSPFGAGGINCYAYCEGDPVNSSDPSGHLSERTWISSSISALRAGLYVLGKVCNLGGAVGGWQHKLQHAGGKRKLLNTSENIVELFDDRIEYIPHRKIHQAAAPQGKMYRLGMDSHHHYSLTNIETNELTEPHGTYLFVNRVDEGDIIRVGRTSEIIGHTSLTQDYSGAVREWYNPVNVWFAGDMIFDNGELVKWTNGSGHYKPDALRHESNLSPFTRTLLPSEKFKVGTARYVSLLFESSPLDEMMRNATTVISRLNI